MSYTIKYGIKFYANTFKWNIDNFSCNIKKRSDIFQCCGYCCYLVLGCENSGNICYLTIELKGYLAPYGKKIACQYSVFMVSGSGEECINESGKIKKDGKEIYIIFCADFPNAYYTHGNSPTVCFSWCDDVHSEVCSQSVQTVSVISTNILEQGTQTDESLMLMPIRNSFTHAECSTDEFKHSIPGTGAEFTFASDLGKQNEHESHKLLDTLSNDFGNFFENKVDPDCILIVGETEISAHRSILSARSSVFAAMFHHDTSENQSGKVQINDVNPDALVEVLYFMYTGKVRGLSPETAAQMYIISDKYDLIDIRDKCLEYLLCNLTLENICDAALLAHTHVLADLERKAVQFVKDRLQELMESEKWKHFSDAHYKIANKLLCSALIASQIGKI